MAPVPPRRPNPVGLVEAFLAEFMAILDHIEAANERAVEAVIRTTAVRDSLRMADARDDTSDGDAE